MADGQVVAWRWRFNKWEADDWQLTDDPNTVKPMEGFTCESLVLSADYEALRKRCEAVEADAARLDWLERTCVNVADEYGTGSQLYFGTYATAPLRGAIDQAIAAAQEPSHG